MANLQDWLNEKFNEWEKAQAHKQSYYAFARYLDVSQSGLSQWMIGSGVPSGSDLLNIASKVGPEVYDVMGLPRPNANLQQLTVSFASLPPDIRANLTKAITELELALRREGLRPDAADAHRIAIEILAKWGFRYQK